MPTVIKNRIPNPLRLRNTKDKTRTRNIIKEDGQEPHIIARMTISIPLGLKLKLKNTIPDQQISAFITQLIRQYFTQSGETDPRWLLKMEQDKLEAWEIDRKKEEEEIEAKHQKAKRIFEETKKLEKEDFNKSIAELTVKAEQKKKELLED